MPVLFDNVSDISVRGKLDGRGDWRLLESRWSSVREAKDDMEEGIVPAKEVPARSLKGGYWSAEKPRGKGENETYMSLRDDWREGLDARVARGLLRF